MKEYRTIEQWQEICDSAINGNWQQAGQECVDYGFYANDMINFWTDEGDSHMLEATDLCYLAEIAAEKRYKK
jgi:hypothetical protein